MVTTTIKYRPYLSVEEMEHILSKLNREELKDAPIWENLSLILFKAANGMIEGSYKATPRKTLEERLGLDEENEEQIMEQIARDAGVKK